MNEISFLIQGSLLYMGGFLVALLTLQRLIRILNPRFKLPIKFIFGITLLGGILSFIKSNSNLVIFIIIGVVGIYILTIIIKKYLNNKRR